MAICGRCGSRNAKDVHFCQGCGNRLTADPPPRASEPPGLEELRAVVEGIIADRLAGSSTSLPVMVDVHETGNFRLTLVRRDGSDSQTFSLGGDQIDIGRTEGILTFDDPQLSPRHARITPGPSGYVLKDLETRNGVYHRLRGPVDLKDGDQILIGKQVLQFSVVPEFERALTQSVQDGVLLFGTPVAPAWGRLLQMTPGGVASDVFHISRQEVVLGRELGDIVFSDDEFMSRRHAQISLRQARCRLEDLGSSNGTFIRLRGPHVLVPGDFIRLGDELLRFDLR